MTAGQGRTYRYFTGEVLYPFGYGLSYTTFAFSNLVLPGNVEVCNDVAVGASLCTICGCNVSAAVMPVSRGPHCKLQIAATVQNTGALTGAEVAQLYITFENSTVTTANIKLVCTAR